MAKLNDRWGINIGLQGSNALREIQKGRPEYCEEVIEFIQGKRDTWKYNDGRPYIHMGRIEESSVEFARYFSRGNRTIDILDVEMEIGVGDFGN